MYNILDYVKRIGGAMVLLALVNTDDGLVQIVSAAETKCSPAAKIALERNAYQAKAKVPKDNSYAATRGLDKRREKDWVIVNEDVLAQHLRDCGYKQ